MNENVYIFLNEVKNTIKKLEKKHAWRLNNEPL
jgi:hypothetical protein